MATANKRLKPVERQFVRFDALDVNRHFAPVGGITGS